MFAELKEYTAEHVHCKVSQKLGKLATWAKNQRQRKDRLSKEQRELLVRIEFI